MERKKYHSCKLCDFKTSKRIRLAAHKLWGCHLPVLVACPNCDFRASSQDCLKRHQMFHSLKTPHPCPLCSYSAVTVSHLTRHLNRDHATVSHGNSLSNVQPEASETTTDEGNGSEPRTSSSEESLKDHRYQPPPSSSQSVLPKVKVEQTERLRTYRCGLCGYRSYVSAGLAKHELGHQVRSAHKCRLCSFSSRSASRLERHVQRDHPRKKSRARTIPNPPSTHCKGSTDEDFPFPCSQCDYRARYAWCRDKHMKRHRIRAAHQCQVCNYSSNAVYRLTFHQVHHHNPPAIGIQPSSGPAVVRRASNPSQPNRQPSKLGPRKKKERTFDCNRCGFRTTTASNLRSHMRNHFKKMGKQCPLCSYSASAKVVGRHLLRDHRNASDCASGESTSERNPEVNCEEADEILTEVKREPVHQPTKINKRKNTGSSKTCSSCDYATIYRKDMMKHSLRHMWNQKFRCPRCSYSSKVQGKINYHLKRHHKDGPKEMDGSLRQRAEVMRGKVRLLQDEVDRLSSKRKDVQRRKEEALAWKAGTEAAVLALKSEVDRLRQLMGQKSPDLTEEGTMKDLLDAERKVQQSMADLQLRVDEAEKELTKVSEELGSAQGSLVGAEQVLSILESELKHI